MWYKNKNVLVAGGAGMLGQSLVRKLLEQGAHVTATQFKARKLSIIHPRLKVISCDLSDEDKARELFKDKEIAFLAAGVVAGAAGIANRSSALIMQNLRVRAPLIALAAEMGVSRCGVVSSSYVYPTTKKPNVEKEGFVGDPWIPTNYGLGWIERYLETLCRHFEFVTKTRYAIARPTAIYGPYDRFDPEHSHVIPALIRRAVARENPFEVWGNGQDVRSFTYVDDLADGLMRMVETQAEGAVLNICSPEASTVKDVLGHLFEIVDFHPRVVFKSDRPSMIPYKVSDSGKAKKVLGWEAKVGLREGLQRTVEWYRASLAKPEATHA